MTPRATSRALIITGLVGLGALAPSAWSVSTMQWGGATGASPRGIAMDAVGNIYTANYDGGNITKISADGSTTEVFAVLPVRTSPPAPSSPTAIEVDSRGNVYVVMVTFASGLGGAGVVKYLPTGQLDTTFGTNGLGGITSQPTRLAVDSTGRVLGTAWNFDLVWRTPATGSWSGTAPSFGASTGDEPFGIALDAAGNVYTANRGGNSVTRISADGTTTSQTWVSTGAGTGPFALAFDASGNLFTANSGSNSVSKITIAGSSGTAAPFGTTGTNPQDVAVDGSGNVYTANQGSNSVTRIPANGSASAQYGGTTGNDPVGIVVDSAGNAFTVNRGSNSVTRIGSPAGPLTFSPTAFPSTAVGSTGTLTVTVTNSAAALAATPSAITASGTGVSVTGGTCAVGRAIAARGTCTVALSWKPTAAGALSGAGLTIAYPGGTSASSTTTLTGTATSARALTATITASKARVASGTTLRVGIRTRNAGSTSAAKVVSCIKVPSNFAIVSAKGAKRSGRTLCFNVGTVAAGKSATRTITVGAVSTRTVKRFFTGTTKATGIAQAKATRKAVTITAVAPDPRVTG